MVTHRRKKMAETGGASFTNLKEVQVSSQGYLLKLSAASQPNHVVLYQTEPDRMRAELIALHVVVEDSAREYDRRAEGYQTNMIRQLLLPVPLSKYRAGFDLGELVAGFEDTFWEVRLADTDSILARLADVRPCGPACRWTTEQDADDGSTLDFVLSHGPGCDEAEEDDGPAELEAAA